MPASFKVLEFFDGENCQKLLQKIANIAPEVRKRRKGVEAGGERRGRDMGGLPVSFEVLEFLGTEKYQNISKIANFALVIKLSGQREG